MLNALLGAASVPTVGAAGGMAQGIGRENGLKSLVYAQAAFSENFSSYGIRQYSKIAGTKINTINDLASAIRSGAVKPSQLSIDVGRVNGKDYIMNTRTATALERANVPRSQWNIIDKTKDKEAMDRLRAQLTDARNITPPGQSISRPASNSDGHGPHYSNNSSGGGLLGAIGRAAGLW